MKRRKCVILLITAVIALILIIVTIVVSTSGAKDSYFNSIVNASLRNEVLTTKESKNGDQLFKSDISTEQAFNHYDEDQNGKISRLEFDNILQDLFRDAYGNPHSIDSEKAKEMYSIFSQEGEMNLKDFKYCWNCWIKTVLRPVSAFIVVDVQNDFITGSLAVKDYPAQEDGADIVPVVNNLLDTAPFDNIFYSQDWHPTDHISFFDNLNLPGRGLLKTAQLKSKVK